MKTLAIIYLPFGVLTFVGGIVLILTGTHDADYGKQALGLIYSLVNTVGVTGVIAYLMIDY